MAVYTIMNLKRSSSVSTISELIDAVMDGYVNWREESAAVEAAYHTWRGASPDQRTLAFDDYFAALDREEQAASEYRRLVESAEAAVVLARAEAVLFLDRPLSGRSSFQPRVRDRLTALDRQSVRPLGEPRFGALDRVQFALQVLGAAGVELILVEVLGASIARVDDVVALERAVAPERGHRLLDPGAFVGEQLAGACWFHGRQATAPG